MEAKTANTARFTWTIENFSKLNTEELYSEFFYVGGYKWRVLIYPKGNNSDHLSIYLYVADSETLPKGWSINIEFGLYVINHIDNKSTVKKATKQQFNAEDDNWGFPKFMPLSKLCDPARSYLVNDKCTVEVDFPHFRSDELTVEAAKTAASGEDETPKSSSQGDIDRQTASGTDAILPKTDTSGNDAILPKTDTSGTDAILPKTDTSGNDAILPKTDTSGTDAILPKTDASGTDSILPQTDASGTDAILPQTDASGTDAILPQTDTSGLHPTSKSSGEVIKTSAPQTTQIVEKETTVNSPMGSPLESSSLDDMDAYISKLVSVVETDAPFDSTTEGLVAASIPQSTIDEAKKIFIKMISWDLSEIPDFSRQFTESISVLSKFSDLNPAQLAELNTLEAEFPTLLKTYQTSNHSLKEVDEKIAEKQGTKKSLVGQVKINAFAFQMQRAIHKDLISKEAKLQQEFERLQADLAKIPEKKKGAEKEMKQLHGKMVNLEQSRSSVLEEISTLETEKKTAESTLSSVQQKWTQLRHTFMEPNN